MSTPRSEIIRNHTREALRDSGMPRRKFAATVVEHYHARTLLHERGIEFHAGGDPFEAERANDQLVGRILNGAVRFPCDLEEAWVQALPDIWRQSLVLSLARRYGLLGASLPPLPTAAADDQMRPVSALLAEVGRAVQSLAPILADGRIDAGDAAQIPDALRKVQDLQALCATISHALLQALPGSGAQVVPMRGAG